MKKSVKIALIIVLAVCACLLVTAIAVFSGSADVYTGGNNDCRYPYNWKVSEKGTLGISVTAPKGEKLAWEIVKPEQKASIETTQLKRKGKYDEFELKPVASGIHSVQLVCADAAGKVEISLNISVLVNSDLSFENIQVGEKDFTPNASGETESCGYSIYINNAATIEVAFNYAEGAAYSWQKEGETEVAVKFVNAQETNAVQGITISLPEEETQEQPASSMGISLSAGEALPQSIAATSSQSIALAEPKKATHTIRLLGEDLQKKQNLLFNITFESIDGKISTIVSHSIEEVLPLTEDEISANDKAVAEKALGKAINKIANSEDWVYLTKGSVENSDLSLLVSFKLNGNMYEYTITTPKSHEQFVENFALGQEESKEQPAANSPYTAYTSSEDTLAIVWQASEKISCSLVTLESTGLEELVAVAQQL